jgi:hypothetical protein
MNLIKKIQHRVGVALTPAEEYERAFTQGVLLGPAKFASAGELFDRAAAHAQRSGDGQLQRQAQANALLYKFLSGGSPQCLAPLHEVLGTLPDIERVGSQFERMSTQALRHEVAGRLAEFAVAMVSPVAHLERARLHHSAARSFHDLGPQALMTYAHRPDGFALDRGHLRGFLHDGLGRYHEACDRARLDPSAAAELIGGALVALHQTSAPAQRAEAEAWLERLRSQRACWSCKREFSGAGLHFDSVSATVHEYTLEVLHRAGEDDASVDLRGQTIILCTTCRSAVSVLADITAQRRVAELRVEFERHVASLEHKIAALDRRISNLKIPF